MIAFSPGRRRRRSARRAPPRHHPADLVAGQAEVGLEHPAGAEAGVQLAVGLHPGHRQQRALEKAADVRAIGLVVRGPGDDHVPVGLEPDRRHARPGKMYPGTAEPPRANSLSPSVEKVGSRSPGLAAAIPGTASTAAATAAARSCGPRLPIATTTPGTAGWIAIAAARGTFSPPLPTIPRFPIIGDPLLRRIRMPADLDAVTTVGDEADPEAVGLSSEIVEAIWDSALGLYRSGVHPALTLCLRRDGQVVIDRAIGHARGNGPGDAEDVPKTLATPDTPFCVYSTSKAVTAMLVHMFVEPRRAGARRPGRPAHPRVLPPRQGRDHDRARARAPRRSGLAAARGARARPARRPRAPGRADLRREARDSRRASCSPTTRSRAASSSARSSSA